MFKEDLFMMRTVCISDDFDLEKIRVSGQCFRVGTFPDGTYRFISGDRVLYIREGARGEFSVSCSESEWDEVWRPWFDLDRSYSDIRDNCRGIHPFMDLCMESGAGLRILKQDYWEMLITFIISQRKNIPAITSCVEKLCSRFGRRIGTGDFGEELMAFPEPEALAAAAAAGGLSDCSLGYRADYVADASRRVAEGEIDLDALESLGDEELVSALKEFKGVGDKVANCVALFGYSRTGLAPVDVWIGRAIDEQFGGKNPFPDYGENGGIMQQYVFYHMKNGG